MVIKGNYVSKKLKDRPGFQLTQDLVLLGGSPVQDKVELSV